MFVLVFDKLKTEPRPTLFSGEPLLNPCECPLDKGSTVLNFISQSGFDFSFQTCKRRVASREEGRLFSQNKRRAAGAEYVCCFMRLV